MNRRRLRLLCAFGLAVAAWASARAAGPAKPDPQTFVHVLNRVAFGPRQGDLERVKALGLDRYLDDQLHPERLPDRAVGDRLARLETLTLSSTEISARFERPLLEMRRNARKNDAGTVDGAQRSRDSMAMLRQVNSVLLELAEQKVLRAIYSDRQLQEVLTDFWFNHFNVDARKGRDRFLITEYERDAIRPHVLGRFRDLLEATAKSLAMLFYLDNWMSIDPNGPHPAAPLGRRRLGGGFGPVMPGRMPRGLNENYGRELMELHTLGVDGGYTQQDVTEVARAFTGWTMTLPQRGAEFRFEPRLHDDGEKVVLGHRIRSGGIKDGEAVLDILAAHPSTARFIATKLARRFVSDEPPAGLVDRLAGRFHDTNGDLREVMKALLTAPEFLDAAAYRAKVKTPFEFVVSAVRAIGAEVTDARPLVRTAQELGMPLYQCQPPTGYKDTADAWANTGALVNRMNFALSLVSGRLPGITLRSPFQDSAQPPDANALVATILSGNASAATRMTIAKAATEPQMAALALGAPEFQRR